MWGNVPVRCPSCGAGIAPDFVFCHRCGTPLRYAYVPAPGPAYPPAMYVPAPPPIPREMPPGLRTKRGLGITAGALIAFALPLLSAFGALLMSVGSTLLFLDRRPFKVDHQSAMKASYALFWVAAIVYVAVFGAFLSQSYDAYLAFQPARQIRGPTEFFIAATTAPTALLVSALGLQVRYLLPRSLRWHLPASVGLLLGLAVVATYLAYMFVPPGLGTEGIHISTVAGILNDVSVYRMTEMPGFLWLAYLYYRAFGNVVPGRSPSAAARAAGRQA